jgi:UDP-N-acetylmuramoylalanine--D-glutamate ligase
VELSSFQLHWQRALRPKAGAVLNLADDHLDWHGSLESYGEAKAKVFAGNDVAVFNADDEWSTRLVEAAGDRRVSFTLGVPQAGQLGVDEDRLVDRAFGEDVELALLSEVRPAGPHNVANALAAAALARAHGVEPAAVAAGLRDFEPGAHRSVLIAEADGVSYVDDSKATNPHAADAALRAHDSVVWIAGGLLKGADVDELVRANAGRLATAVLIGRDRGEFSAALGRHAPDVPVHEVASGDDAGMLEAVRLAHDSARPGSVVLLAPAAASMDMFTDYAHRGRAFADAVRDVLSETPAATTRGG